MSFNNTNTDILIVSSLSQTPTRAILIQLKGWRLCGIRSRPFGLPSRHHQDSSTVTGLQATIHQPLHQSDQPLPLSWLVPRRRQRHLGHDSIMSVRPVSPSSPDTHSPKQEPSSPPMKAQSPCSATRPSRPPSLTRSPPRWGSWYRASSSPPPKS